MVNTGVNEAMLLRTGFAHQRGHRAAGRWSATPKAAVPDNAFRRGERFGLRNL